MPDVLKYLCIKLVSRNTINRLYHWLDDLLIFKCILIKRGLIPSRQFFYEYVYKQHSWYASLAKWIRKAVGNTINIRSVLEEFQYHMWYDKLIHKYKKLKVMFWIMVGCSMCHDSLGGISTKSHQSFGLRLKNISDFNVVWHPVNDSGKNVKSSDNFQSSDPLFHTLDPLSGDFLNRPLCLQIEE